MGPYQNDRDEANKSYYHESDSYDDPRFDTDGNFTHQNFQFERSKSRNRFGESHIKHDSYQDDQFKNDYDPTYQDEYGMKHPYEHGGKRNSWSDDIRSEASRENHFGKGPKGYQRSDQKILEDACELLTRSPELDATDIEVSVVDRCIYLKGFVNTRKEKKLAEELVDHVSGIDDVWNQIKIKSYFEDDTRPRGAEPDGPAKGLV